ncbi:MAG: DNA cytosine methyltransferase [Kiritimatiellia bacterium]
MPTLNATDLTKRLTGQADRSGVFVMQPSGFDPYEPGGVKSASPEVSGALVNGSSPGYHNAVCFENHQTDARIVLVDVAPTMGATHNAQAANNNPLVVVPDDAVVAIDMDKNKPTNADRPVRKGGAGFGVSEKGASYTLTARDQHAVAYAIDSMGSNAMKSKNPKSGCREVECAPTLTTVDSAPVKHQGGTAVVEEVVGVFDMGARKTGAGTDTSGASPTILAAHGTDPHAVAIGLDRASFNQGRNAQFGFTVEEECAPTVVAKGPGAVSFDPGIARREGALHRFMSELASTLRSDMGDNLLAVAIDYIVRRLTPLECERLQGLPDGYTKIPYRGKSAENCPDTPRYKALGNGWAVNCARWICQRIQNYDRKHTEEN